MRLGLLLISCFLVIFTSSVGYSYSSHYELLSDSTIEIQDVALSLTGTFDFSPLLLPIGPNGPFIPEGGHTHYYVNNLVLSGGDERIIQDYTSFHEHASIFFPDLTPSIISLVLGSGGIVEEMYGLVIDRTYLSEPTPDNLYFKDRVLIPQSPYGSFNYFIGFDPSVDIFPSEIFLTYVLVEKHIQQSKMVHQPHLIGWQLLNRAN
nr:hypothetical protein [Desulfobacula sp.]